MAKSSTLTTTVMSISPNNHTGFYTRLEHALLTTHPAEKCALVAALWGDWQAGSIDWPDEPACKLLPQAVVPADQVEHPDKPELIDPSKLRARQMGTPEGRAIMLHAVAHIEYNAINLGLDAAYRFRFLPREFTGGWLRVAHEEVEHFGLVTAHLAIMGYAYGDFPAHRGLWVTACKTAHDPLVRMALILRLFEAHGLDVTPGITEKFRQAGDAGAVAALEVILREEVGHVALGDYWFRHLCAEHGLPVEATYQQLIAEYDAPRLKPPYNTEARLQAGFTVDELESLARFAVAKRFPSN
jgi:uncharacterized ferritin-like protein (DUF455 family)